MGENKLSIIVDNDVKNLSVNTDAGVNQLTVNTNTSTTLLDFDADIEEVFTENLTSIFSDKYQDGDRYVNEWVHFMSAIGTVLTQEPDDLYTEDRIEKQLFKITCPDFTGEEEFYNESLSFYILFHNFYTVPNIITLLKASVEGLKTGTFYNTRKYHFFMFFKDDYTDFEFTLNDKFIKNVDLISKMSPAIWYNDYYKLRRDTLQVGGSPFLINGEELVLDIVERLSVVASTEISDI